MTNILAALTRPITERIRYKNEVRREFDLIRGDKVATLIDLTACFYDAAKPRGMIGEDFQFNTFNVMQGIGILSHYGVFPVYDLPVSVAHTKTREQIDLITKEIDKSVRESEEYFRRVLSSIEPDKIKFQYMAPPPIERMQALYLGDFIEMLDKSFGFRKGLNLACYLGHGENTLAIVKDLRNVPDYSSHFPPRPPRNGQGKKSTEPERPVPVGQLNPV